MWLWSGSGSGSEGGEGGGGQRGRRKKKKEEEEEEERKKKERKKKEEYILRKKTQVAPVGKSCFLFVFQPVLLISAESFFSRFISPRFLRKAGLLSGKNRILPLLRGVLARGVEEENKKQKTQEAISPVEQKTQTGGWIGEGHIGEAWTC